MLDRLNPEDYSVTEDCIGCPHLKEVYEKRVFGDKIYGVPAQSNTCLGVLEKCFVKCTFREDVDDPTETNCLCVSEFFVDSI